MEVDGLMVKEWVMDLSFWISMASSRSSPETEMLPPLGVGILVGATSVDRVPRLLRGLRELFLVLTGTIAVGQCTTAMCCWSAFFVANLRESWGHTWFFVFIAIDLFTSNSEISGGEGLECHARERARPFLF